MSVYSGVLSSSGLGRTRNTQFGLCGFGFWSLMMPVTGMSFEGLALVEHRTLSWTIPMPTQSGSHVLVAEWDCCKTLLPRLSHTPCCPECSFWGDWCSVPFGVPWCHHESEHLVHSRYQGHHFLIPCSVSKTSIPSLWETQLLRTSHNPLILSLFKLLTIVFQILANTNLFLEVPFFKVYKSAWYLIKWAALVLHPWFL